MLFGLIKFLLYAKIISLYNLHCFYGMIFKKNWTSSETIKLFWKILNSLKQNLLQMNYKSKQKSFYRELAT